MPPQPAPFQPVFIVGCERSGTTLLAVLLGRHSQLAITPETHFCFKFARRRSSHDAALDAFYRWQRTAALNLDRPTLAARFALLAPTPANLFQSALETFAAHHHKPRVGEKTPFHLFHVPTLLSWYPQAKVVCIVRDGRDVVLSILRAPWTPHQMIREHCRRWLQAVDFGEFLLRRYPQNVTSITYEDLVRNPQSTLADVDAFLDLPFEPTQLDLNRPTSVIPPEERAWKALADGSLDPTRIGDYARRATPAHLRIMNSLLAKTLRRLGYPATSSPPAPLFTRGFDTLANTACRLHLHHFTYNVLRYTPRYRAHRQAGQFPKPAVPTPQSLSS